MKVDLITITPEIETTIVEIARASSGRKDKKAEPEGLINYLVKNKHWSPFEHGFLTFEVHTSKAIAIQLLRHRSNYFQEFSQRYQDVNKLDEGEGIFELYDFRLQAQDNRQSSTDSIAELKWSKEQGYHYEATNFMTVEQINALKLTTDSYNMAERAYNAQLDAGIAREVARFVLPMATRTKLYVTMNVRSVIHWLDLRADHHAQKEIRLIAAGVKEAFIKACPIISAAREYIS
jgi:thymidylate synthase (FAD)